MTVYKNKITGEYHIAENKTRAWLYFFYEAERKGKERPEMYDITEIEIDKRTIDFKNR
jgi:hypothetical protein